MDGEGRIRREIGWGKQKEYGMGEAGRRGGVYCGVQYRVPAYSVFLCTSMYPQYTGIYIIYTVICVFCGVHGPYIFCILM